MEIYYGNSIENINNINITEIFYKLVKNNIIYIPNNNNNNRIKLFNNTLIDNFNDKYIFCKDIINNKIIVLESDKDYIIHLNYDIKINLSNYDNYRIKHNLYSNIYNTIKNYDIKNIILRNNYLDNILVTQNFNSFIPNDIKYICDNNNLISKLYNFNFIHINKGYINTINNFNNSIINLNLLYYSKKYNLNINNVKKHIIENHNFKNSIPILNINYNNIIIVDLKKNPKKIYDIINNFTIYNFKNNDLYDILKYITLNDVIIQIGYVYFEIIIAISYIILDYNNYNILNNDINYYSQLLLIKNLNNLKFNNTYIYKDYKLNFINDKHTVLFIDNITFNNIFKSHINIYNIKLIIIIMIKNVKIINNDLLNNFQLIKNNKYLLYIKNEI